MKEFNENPLKKKKEKKTGPTAERADEMREIGLTPPPTKLEKKEEKE